MFSHNKRRMDNKDDAIQDIQTIFFYLTGQCILISISLTWTIHTKIFNNSIEIFQYRISYRIV